jgi:hypothetical protein
VKVVIVCEFTPRELDEIEFRLDQIINQFGDTPGVWPPRCDALQDAAEIIQGLRGALWEQGHRCL